VKSPCCARAVTYAYLPQYAHTVSYERHRLLLDYLSRATGLPLRQVFPDTFEEHVRMVERGEIDISFSNPFAYIRMAASGARAFARIIEPSGKPDFKSQIICRHDNRQLKSIADCRGKRWMAVDPSSAGGYIYALGEFFDNGIRRSDFAEITFAPGPGGKQEKVVLAVFAGVCDIGSVRDGTLEILRGRIDLGQIRVLAESKSYPGWVYSVRAGFSPEIVEKIGRAMFALRYDRPDDAAILAAAGMRGIIPAADADYDSVRRLAETLGLDALPGGEE
jgi:phosphonate transport system substrate-binding protein